VSTVTHPDAFPLGTTALLSKTKGTFPKSGTQKWMTVGADRQVVFRDIEPGDYLLRVGGQIVPVQVKPEAPCPVPDLPEEK
jgi:hypothetical protein